MTKIDEIFDNYPEPVRAGLLKLREMIFAEAATLPETGGIEEVLRWGQPSYITAKKDVGTTLRLGVPKTGGFAIYTHCQSTVISDFTTLFPMMDKIDGNRAVIFDDASEIDPERHSMLIRRALTYHL